jgi:hypothetical protein
MVTVYKPTYELTLTQDGRYPAVALAGGFIQCGSVSPEDTPSPWAAVGINYMPQQPGVLQFQASITMLEYDTSYPCEDFIWLGQFVNLFDSNGNLVGMPVNTQASVQSYGSFSLPITIGQQWNVTAGDNLNCYVAVGASAGPDDSQGCTVQATVGSITITLNPGPAPSVLISGASTIPKGQSQVYKAKPSNLTDPINYVWSGPLTTGYVGGHPTPQPVGQSITIKANSSVATTTTLSVMATDAQGNTASDKINITVTD